MRTHPWSPVSASPNRDHCLLLLSSARTARHLLARHEAFESVQSLLQRTPLAWRQVLGFEKMLEGAVVKCRVGILLGDPKLTQYTCDHMEVQRHATAVDRAHGHQVEHSLRVEVSFIEAQSFNLDVGDFAVDSLGQCQIGFDNNRRRRRRDSLGSGQCLSVGTARAP